MYSNVLSWFWNSTCMWMIFSFNRGKWVVSCCYLNVRNAKYSKLHTLLGASKIFACNISEYQDMSRFFTHITFNKVSFNRPTKLFKLLSKKVVIRSGWKEEMKKKLKNWKWNKMRTHSSFSLCDYFTTKLNMVM